MVMIDAGSSSSSAGYGDVVTDLVASTGHGLREMR
jgi:hypothetical protein